MQKKIPLFRACFYIFLSIFLVSGSTHLGLQWYLCHYFPKVNNDKPKISYIIQTNPGREKLSTALLAKMTGFYEKGERLSVKKAQENLKKSPIIKEATIKQISKDTLYIDYLMRTPIAFLYDFENIAIDAEGVLFPFYPFYAPKKLPYVYLGLKQKFEEMDTCQLEEDLFKHARSIILATKPLVLEKKLSLERIDLSRIKEKSLGKREIILSIQSRPKWSEANEQVHHYLRISTNNYLQDLGNYFKVLDDLSNTPKELRSDSDDCSSVIDLRLSDTAIIKKE